VIEQPAALRPSAPSASPFQAADADAAERDRLVLIETNRALLGRTLQYVKGQLDMMGLQRAQSVLRGVREEWMALGHFGPLFEQAQEKPVELVIRKLSDDEEVEIQRRAEASAHGFDGDFDFLDEECDDETDEHAGPAAASQPVYMPSVQSLKGGSGVGTSQEGSPAYTGGPGNSCGGGAGQTGSSADRQAEANQRWLTRFTLPSDPPLPARDDFRDWLRTLVDRYGRVTLRDLLQALGATDPAICESRDKEFLIAQILRWTDGDPSKLLAFVVDGTA
jgi:hypothetical protein